MQNMVRLRTKVIPCFETRAVMNIYDWAKNKEELVEVIYACMDGYVYFLELETGDPTRDAH